MSAGTDPADLLSIIVPRHAVETSDFARHRTDRAWVSGGPFILSDWQPGQFLELSRNEQYWKVTQAEGAPLPFLERIVVRFYEPGDSIDPRLVDGFERGEIGLAVFDRAESRTGEFARAVAHAIDREASAAVRGTAVADSILDRFVPGLGDRPLGVYDFDLEAVAAGIGSEGPPVLLTVPGDSPATVALGGDLVTMMRDAGFEAELQLEDASLFFGTTLDNGSWGVSAWRFGAGSGLGAAIDFMRFFDPDGLPFVGDNYFRWGTVDSTVSNDATRHYRGIIDALDRAIDPNRIRDLLVEAEAILADQVVILPLVLAGEVGVAHRPEAVSGIAVNPVQGPLGKVDTWRVSVGGGS